MTKRLKGALHAHTRASDGSQEPAELVAHYREMGYDFVFLTDHNKVTHCGDLDNFLVLPGIEVGSATKNPDQYWHFVGLMTEAGATPPMKAPPDVLWPFVRRTSPFGFLAHPYWSQVTGRDLLRFPGLSCVEVWNTGCEQELTRGHGEYPWDWALSAGAKMTAVAVDDCHGFDDVGKGWVSVEAEAFTGDAIVDALSRGAYYSSCGPEIREFRLDGNTVTAVTSPCRSIALIADRQCGKYVPASPGRTVESASLVLEGKERYVRAECVDAQGRKAWSNPLFL